MQFLAIKQMKIKTIFLVPCVALITFFSFNLDSSICSKLLSGKTRQFTIIEQRVNASLSEIPDKMRIEINYFKSKVAKFCEIILKFTIADYVNIQGKKGQTHEAFKELVKFFDANKDYTYYKDLLKIIAKFSPEALIVVWQMKRFDLVADLIMTGVYKQQKYLLDNKQSSDSKKLNISEYVGAFNINIGTNDSIRELSDFLTTCAHEGNHEYTAVAYTPMVYKSAILLNLPLFEALLEKLESKGLLHRSNPMSKNISIDGRKLNFEKLAVTLLESFNLDVVIPFKTFDLDTIPAAKLVASFIKLAEILKYIESISDVDLNNSTAVKRKIGKIFPNAKTKALTDLVADLKYEKTD